jgi:hypothetical protein
MVSAGAYIGIGTDVKLPRIFGMMCNGRSASRGG